VNPAYDKKSEKPKNFGGDVAQILQPLLIGCFCFIRFCGLNAVLFSYGIL